MVVFHRRAEAEACIRSCVPGSAIVQFDVGFDCATKRGKWLLRVVVVAMNVRECIFLALPLIGGGDLG